MDLGSVSNQLTNSTSLYRPVPMNKLQQNLSEHYQKTSGFINEKFKEMLEMDDAGKSASKRNFSSLEGNDEPRLNPQGMGQLIDIMA